MVATTVFWAWAGEAANIAAVTESTAEIALANVLVTFIRPFVPLRISAIFDPFADNMTLAHRPAFARANYIK